MSTCVIAKPPKGKLRKLSPSSYDLLTDNYTICCIDLTLNQDNFHAIKKRKPARHATLSTIGPIYWEMILSFFKTTTTSFVAIISLVTLVALNKEFYKSRSYLLSKFPLCISIVALNDIRDCNPSRLWINYTRYGRWLEVIGLQHLDILRTMTNLRNLRIELVEEICVPSLERLQTLDIDFDYMKTYHRFNGFNGFNGIYNCLRSLKIRSIPTFLLSQVKSFQFPNLLMLDVSRESDSTLPDSFLPPKLQVFRESGGNEISLRLLVHCKDIQVIDVRSLRKVDLPLVATDGFPNLKVLRCGMFTQCENLDFLQAWKMQSLIELRVPSGNLVDISAVSVLQTLQTVSFIYTRIEKISPLIALSRLDTLELHCCDSVEDLESLAFIPCLKLLYYHSESPNQDCIVKKCLQNSKVNIVFDFLPLPNMYTMMNEASISAQVLSFGLFFSKESVSSIFCLCFVE